MVGSSLCWATLLPRYGSCFEPNLISEMLARSMLGRVFFLCFCFTFVLCPCSELAVSLYEIDGVARLVKKMSLFIVDNL